MKHIKHNNLKIVDYEIAKNNKVYKKSYVEHQGAVAIIAITSEHEIVLTKQRRYPLDLETIEIPAGKIENNESSIEAAKRELLEETGYIANEIELIGSFYTTPGFSNQLLDIYWATNITKLENKEVYGVDIDEEIEVIQCKITEFKTMKISDFKTAYAQRMINERYPN